MPEYFMSELTRNLRQLARIVSLSGIQRTNDEITRDAGFRDADGEPAAHILVETYSVHVVIERLVERSAEYGMVDAGSVDEFDVVGGESDRGQRLELDAVLRGIEADR